MADQYRTTTSRDCAEGHLTGDVCEIQAAMDRQSERIEDGTSPNRSSVEAQKAPNFELVPVSRAICPSMRSLKTNAVITRTPVSSIPCGKNTSAPAHTPSVPTKVTASGLTPSLMKKWTKGARTTPCQKSLDRSSMPGG
jgi:hypothetical protein